MTRTEEAESKLIEQEQQFETSLKENIQDLQNKHLSFYQQFKEDLKKLDRLKTRIVKEVKENREGFDSFDTEVEYETVFGGLIARL